MSHSQHPQYLASKVLTAPPHRLHLMLIEGAVRHGRHAELAMRRGDRAAASEPLMRVIDIVGELVAGVREGKTKLNKQIADLYLLLFRMVSEAKINNDAEKLADALQLLDFERETWQLVCDKLGTSETQRPDVPLFGDGVVSSTSCGLSLEA